MNAVDLSIFASQLVAVADEMGAVLRRAAFSPNIRDRLDYSCALFDAHGGIVAQSAHIPVHLGSMAYAMASIVDSRDWQAGETIAVNDPFLGGTHLPDITLIQPVFVQQQLLGFVANRAHHASIGADTPGSMPLSSSLEEEGVVIPPTRIAFQGKLIDSVFRPLVGRLGESSGPDFIAQWSANQRGEQRLCQLILARGIAGYRQGLQALNDYGRTLAEHTFRQIPDGNYHFADVMDGDGLGNQNIPVCCQIEIKKWGAFK